jgi:hypothetical protein
LQLDIFVDLTPLGTNLISDRKLRFLRKIVEVQPICPVNVLSYRRQNNVALETSLLYFSKFSIKMKANKQQQKGEAKNKQTIIIFCLFID